MMSYPMKILLTINALTLMFVESMLIHMWVVSGPTLVFVDTHVFYISIQRALCRGNVSSTDRGSLYTRPLTLNKIKCKLSSNSGSLLEDLVVPGMCHRQFDVA